jgi:hypothetical protein
MKVMRTGIELNIPNEFSSPITFMNRLKIRARIKTFVIMKRSIEYIDENTEG